MFPVPLLDAARLRKLPQPVYHVAADADGELPSLSTMILTVVLGDEDGLISAPWHRDVERARRPDYGTEVKDQWLQTAGTHRTQGKEYFHLRQVGSANTRSTGWKY